MLQYKNSSIEHFNVIISTPGKSMTSEYVKSLLSTIKVLDQKGISWYYANEYSPIITNAREATVSCSTTLNITNSSPGQGQFTYDKIFFIDSDIVWNPDQFLKMYDSQKDVVSGVYYNSYGTNAMIHLTKESSCPMTRDEVSYQTDLFSVYGVGLGFLSLKKGVLESLERPWFRIGQVVVNMGGKDYTIPVGEDLYFCERISEKGYDVWVDPSISVGHVKSNIIG